MRALVLRNAPAFVLFEVCSLFSRSSSTCDCLACVCLIMRQHLESPKKVDLLILHSSRGQWLMSENCLFVFMDFIDFNQGKELAESERVEMRQADGMASLSLHRITADDSGKYIVMAENTFGMDCHYASLAVEGKCGS